MASSVASSQCDSEPSGLSDSDEDKEKWRGGYDLQFTAESEVGEDEHCAVCHLVLRDPMLSRCGHHMCNDCLNVIAARADRQTFSCPTCRTTHDENLPRIRVEFAASLSKRLIANSRRDLVVTSRRLAAIPWRGSVEFAVTDRESVVIHCEFVAGFDADSW